MLYRFIILFGFIAGCSTTRNVTGVHDKSFAEIETFLKSLIDTAGIPGVAIAITVDKDIVYTNAFGLKNVDTKEKVEPKNTFHIAFVSKIFTATAVMQLYERGKINNNKPLITYLPYFKLKDERYKDITIKEMLNHTSGVPDVEDYE